jgi:sugar phosphate permease
VVLTASSGLGFYNLSVYISVLATARGFAVSEMSGAASLLFVVGGIAGMGVARLMESVDTRHVMAGGALLAAAALAAAGQATTLTGVYVLFALFGIGNAGISIVTSTTLVTRWFPGRDRAVALSVASTGLSMGGILLTPLTAAWFEAFGVERTMGQLAALLLVVTLPVVWWLVRDPPPEGAPADGGVSRLEVRWRYGQAVRTPFFAILSTAFVLCMSAQVGGISHLYNQSLLVADNAVAARAVQALALCSILMRLASGFVLRVVSIARFAVLNGLMQAGGLTVIACAATPTGALAGAALFGASVGNLLMLHPLWLAEAFGAADYPRIFATANAISVLGVASGPLLLGLIFDTAGYGVAYGVAAGLSLVATLLMASLASGPGRTAK